MMIIEFMSEQGSLYRCAESLNDVCPDYDTLGIPDDLIVGGDLIAVNKYETIVEVYDEYLRMDASANGGWQDSLARFLVTHGIQFKQSELGWSSSRLPLGIYDTKYEAAVATLDRMAWSST